MKKLTGPKSFIACIRSRRMPFGRSFQVGGNKLIKLKSREPPDAFCVESVHGTQFFHFFMSYRSIESQNKGVAGAGSLLLGSERKFMLHPFICNTLRGDLSNSKDFAIG